MTNRKTLDDAINELRRFRTSWKKKTPSSARSNYDNNWKQCLLEKRTNMQNAYESNSVFPPLDSNSRIKPYSPKLTSIPNQNTADIQEITCNDSFYYSTNDIKIIKRTSIEVSENLLNKSTANVRAPTITPNSPRKRNPRFINTTKTNEQPTTTTPSISLDSQSQAPAGPRRVHFDLSNFSQPPKALGDKYFKFGFRLLREGSAQNRAAGYFKKSADYGNLRGMLQYARMLYKGYSIGMNKQKAKMYYRNAFLKGDQRSMQKFRPLMSEDSGFKRDKKEAARYFKMAADKGDLNAIRFYRAMCFDGDGIPKNRKEAAHYYKIEADKYGDVISLRQYAAMLYHGDGVEKDKKEAARYFKRAADQGDASAIRQFGYLLQTGAGVDRNYREAVRYYKMAADKGDEIAMRQYAFMLYNGYGTRVNKREAARFYKMAADAGDNVAATRYAAMLNDGDGIDMNKVEAAKYLKKS